MQCDHSEIKASDGKKMIKVSSSFPHHYILTFLYFSIGLSPMQNACVWVWLWFTARLSVQSLTWLMDGTPRHVCATPQDTQDWSSLVRTPTFVERCWCFPGFLCRFVGPTLDRFSPYRKHIPLYCFSQLDSFLFVTPWSNSARNFFRISASLTTSLHS